MDSDRTVEDEIREYRAQFEKSMASFAANDKKLQAKLDSFAAEDKKFQAKLDSLAAEDKKLQARLASIAAMHEEIAAEQKKTDEQQKKTDSKLRELNTNWGRFVESLVEGDLVDLLSRCGVEVHETYTSLKKYYLLEDGTRRTREFDIVAANGEEVVVVEVKTTLKPEDVDRFVSKMREIGRYFPRYAANVVYGAVAYIRCEEGTDRYAERQGLYVIRATGGSASIVNAGGFKPQLFTKAGGSRRPHGHLRAVPAG